MSTIDIVPMAIGELKARRERLMLDLATTEQRLTWLSQELPRIDASIATLQALTPLTNHEPRTSNPAPAVMLSRCNSEPPPILNDEELAIAAAMETPAPPLCPPLQRPVTTLVPRSRRKRLPIAATPAPIAPLAPIADEIPDVITRVVDGQEFEAISIGSRPVTRAYPTRGSSMATEHHVAGGGR